MHGRGFVAHTKVGRRSVPEQSFQPSRLVLAFAWINRGCEEKLRAQRLGDSAGGA